MIDNKKGVSMIVSTMIIILLVIVAVGIIWFVARGIFEGGGEQLSLSSKCLAVDMKASGACTAAGVCNVTVERRAGGDAFGGFKMVVASATNNSIVDNAGNVAPLERETASDFVSGVTDPTKIDVVVYFKDDAGAEQLCAGPVATVTL